MMIISDNHDATLEFSITPLDSSFMLLEDNYGTGCHL